MTYFTVLWITILSGPLDGSTSGLIYISHDSCRAAIPVITTTLRDEYDYNIRCEETLIPSASPRPRRNPLYMEN